MWHELVRVYAIRAREFSESAARLGQQASIGPEFLQWWREVQRRRALCNDAGDELNRFIERVGPASKSKSV